MINLFTSAIFPSLQSIADFLRNGFAPHNPILLSLVKLRFDPGENSLKLSATDAKIFCDLTISLPEGCLDGLREPLVFAIEYETVIKFLKLSKAEEFTLSVKDGIEVTFSINRNTLRLPIVTALMHPMPELKGATRLFVQRGPFLESVDACLSVLSTTDISFSSAVRFCHEEGKPWFYAGDRYRAVVMQPKMDCSTLPEFGVTMPAAFIASVASVLANFPTDFIELQFTDNALQIGAANDTYFNTFYTPLRQEELADVRKAFLNASEVTFQSSFQSDDFLRAVEMALLVGKNETVNVFGKDSLFYKVTIEFSEDKAGLEISCSGDKFSSAFVPCGSDSTGECKIYINGDYLKNAIKRVKLCSKEIKMTTLAFSGRGVFGVVFADPEEVMRVVVALIVVPEK